MSSVIPSLAAALTALSFSGCAARPGPGRPETPAAIAPRERPAIPPEAAGRRARWLDRCHHTPVVVHLALDLGQRDLLVYGFESLTAWIAFQRLEPWEREDAAWSADDELALWLDGLGAAREQVHARLEVLRDECVPDRQGRGCEEADLWERAADEVEALGCHLDRLGLASFERDASDAPRFDVLLFDGRRCGAASTRPAPFQLDEDPELELLVDIQWFEADVEHAELYVLDHDLEVLARRRLFDRARGQHARDDGGLAGDARYRVVSAGGSLRIIVERYELPLDCVVRSCRRLETPGADGRCAPLRDGRCAARSVDRESLERDPSTGLWL